MPRYLFQNPEWTLMRGDLLKNVWPDTCVDVNGFAQGFSAAKREARVILASR